MGFKVRVGVVLWEEGKLLLVRQNNRPFWVFPGGTLEVGEGLAECAIRELKEELNLDIDLLQFLYLGDLVLPDRHDLDCFFLARRRAGILQMTEDENLNDVGFFSAEEIATMAIKPKEVVQALLPDLEWIQNCGVGPHGGRYLGKYG